jgi:hypothetical protein
MHDAPLDEHDKPVQSVSVSLSGFGIRPHAGGRSGREVWQIIRRRHPNLTMLCAPYGAVLLTAMPTAANTAFA